MQTYTEIAAATDIRALAALLDDEWYDAVEGDYDVPTWGPETVSVKAQISASCAYGDIVSWDTRDEDPANHLYLRRAWFEAHQSSQPEHIFTVDAAKTYEDILDASYLSDEIFVGAYNSTYPNGDEPDGNAEVTVNVVGSDINGWVITTRDHADGPRDAAGQDVYATKEAATEAAEKHIEESDEPVVAQDGVVL